MKKVCISATLLACTSLLACHFSEPKVEQHNTVNSGGIADTMHHHPHTSVKHHEVDTIASRNGESMSPPVYTPSKDSVSKVKI